MNDRTASEPPREIALARQAPFQLARTEVRPPSLEVEFQSQTTSLEPRVMKVLVALGRMGGQPVSRENLIDLCWAGRVVTDGALNRSIAQLRKALRDPGIQIETIPTVGYRLQAATQPTPPANGAGEPSAHAANGLASASPAAGSAIAGLPASGSVAAEPPANSSHAAKSSATDTRAPYYSPNINNGGAAEAVRASAPRRMQRALLAIAVVLAAGAAAWWFAAQDRSAIWAASEFRPLTSTADQETYPALSPDGTQMVYSSRPDAYSARDLYLRNVEEGTPVRLTSGEGDDFGAAWSPDGTRVAFFRATEAAPCALVVVPVPGGAERVITTCRPTNAESRPSWLNSQTLVFSDQSEAPAFPAFAL